VLRPFLLACNYPDANAKLLTIGLNAIQLLLSGDAVCPEDSTHIVRVLVIQASVSASLHEAAHPHSNNNAASMIMPSNSGGEVSPTKTSSLAGSMMNAVGLSSYSSGGSGSSARSLKEDESVCMKLLQTLTMVVASKDLVLGEEVVAQCVMVCLTLIGTGGGFSSSQHPSSGRGGRGGMLGKKSTKSSADKHGARVRRAAVGTLKQTLSLVFDRALSDQILEDESITPFAEGGKSQQSDLNKEELQKIKQSTRNAAAGAFNDLCTLAEHPSEYLDLPHSPSRPRMSRRRADMQGPFSMGLLASSFGGGGSSKQNLQFIQMPPRPTCFELMDMILQQTPSLFINAGDEKNFQRARRHSSGEGAGSENQGGPNPRPTLSPFRRQNTVGSGNLVVMQDKSYDFSLLLRTKACPLVTTTLLSELTSHNGNSGGGGDAYSNDNIMSGNSVEESDLNFPLLVRCTELASTLIQQFGQIEDLSGECHVLITSLIRYVSAAAEGYQDSADGFEDGFVYSAAQAFLDGAHQQSESANEGVTTTGSSGGPAVKGAAATSGKDPNSHRYGITHPQLVSNTLLWRGALAMEAFHKLLRLPSLVKHFHDLYDNFNAQMPLLAVLIQAVSDFAIIAASNENSIRSVAFRASSASRGGSSIPMSTIAPVYVSKIGARAREYATFFDEWDASVDTHQHSGHVSTSSATSGEYATLASLDFVENVPACDEGETIWLAFQCTLRLLASMNELVIEATDEITSNPEGMVNMEEDDANDTIQIAESTSFKSLISLVDCTFSPCLALLQHFLKRFSGSTIILECALLGYQHLANASMLLLPYNTQKVSVQRKALMTTLCKLAVPSFGRARGSQSFPSPSAPLLNRHVLGLVALFRILHQNANLIDIEWTVVMRTLEQMSDQPIASPKLSDRVYETSEAIANAYTRLPQFTTSVTSHTLQQLTASLAQLSSASARGDKVPQLLDEDIDAAGGGNYNGAHGRKAQQPAPSSSMNFFGFAGRALGVGTPSSGSTGHTESFVDMTVTTDQSRAPLSKTYTSDLYANAATHLPSSNNIRTAANTKTMDLSSRIPFSLVLLVQACLANHDRFDVFGTRVIQHLSALATECELDVVRRYAMDMLAHIISLRFSDAAGADHPGRQLDTSFRRTKHAAASIDALDYLMLVEADGASVEDSVQPTEGTNNGGNIVPRKASVWQAELVTPLCLCIQSATIPEGAECGLTTLYTILENEGHGMEGACWPIIIRGIGSCAGDLDERSSSSWIACGVRAFRCLKLIVDDFLDTLPDQENSVVGQAARHALLDCCASFGSSRHDINTSLTAMGMLWTIADHHSDPSSLDRVFEKLAHLSCDSRVEVRNCGVNTLFSCVAGIGAKFSPQQWEKCFREFIFNVLEQVEYHQQEGRIQDEQKSATQPKAAPANQISINVHHSRDSIEKQWATTLVLTMRGMERLLRQFFIPLLRTSLSCELEYSGDQGSSDSVPSDIENHAWFRAAWERILDSALECASVFCGRDSLEQQYAGIEMLILCCQLASRGGLEAAANPVRVTTNMQVVNGALRQVGPSSSPSKKAPPSKLLLPEGSEADNQLANEQRYDMFLAAFDNLENLLSILNEGPENDEDESFSHGGMAATQVLTRLTAGLSNLYTACMDDEFSIKGENKEDGLEGRFVQMVRKCAIKSSMDAGSKFLNQSQRGCLELLTKMATRASWRAFETLAVLAGSSFVA
jgi:hypothetical protein